MPRRPKPSPKMDRILAEIRWQIISGRMAPGDRLPDRLRMIRTFKASKDTLQSAVDRLVEEGFLTASRKKGTFVTLHPPHRHRVGLVFPWKKSQNWSRYWTLMEEEAHRLRSRSGAPLSLYYYQMGNPSEPEYLRLRYDVENHCVGGLVFASAPFHLYQTSVVNHPGIRRISIMPQGLPPHINHCLWFDFKKFFGMAVQRLVGLGCRRPALLLSSNPSTPALFQDQYRHECKRHRLTAQDFLIQAVDPGNPGWAASVVRLWSVLPENRRPDGLIITDEAFAPHVFAGMKASDTAFRRRLKVVTHANFPAENSSLPFIRLGFDIKNMLTLAVDRIESLHENKAVSRFTLLPPIFEEHFRGHP